MTKKLFKVDKKKTMLTESNDATVYELAPDDIEFPKPSLLEKIELRKIIVGTILLRLVQVGNEKRIEMKAGAEFIPLDTWSRRELANAYPYARNFIEEHTPSSGS